MIITIDGPAASGKSSVARELAKRMNIYYLYTGLLYRAVAFVFAQKYKLDIHEHAGCFDGLKINPEDIGLISGITYEYRDGEPKLFFDGQNITDNLYKREYDQLASHVSANKLVREALLPVQRSIGEKYDIIADGRDCGSVVFPNADYKFYLTASVDVRARRLLEDKDRDAGDNNKRTLEEVKQELEERDHRDINRDVAPLKIPEGALVIDNSEVDLEQTIELFLSEIR